MKTKAKTTWIVIADGMHARFLRHRPGEPLEPAVEPELYDPAVHGYSRDLKSDHPGRAFDPGSGQRHAIEPRHDPHAYEKHQFARRIAGIVNDAAALVVAEVPRDLIKTPTGELMAHFSDALGAY